MKARKLIEGASFDPPTVAVIGVENLPRRCRIFH
jgi:hypothetical protein